MDSTKARLELAQVDDRWWALVHVGRQLCEAEDKLLSVALLLLPTLPPRSKHPRSVPASHTASNVITRNVG